MSLSGERLEGVSADRKVSRRGEGGRVFRQMASAPRSGWGERGVSGGGEEPEERPEG